MAFSNVYHMQADSSHDIVISYSHAAKQTNTVCCKFCGVLIRMNGMNKGYYACADPEGE